MSPKGTSPVFLIDSSDRDAAVSSLFEHAGLGDLSGKSVALEANFNSADAFPASTHPDTLRAIVTLLKEAGAREITLAERSGMGDTRVGAHRAERHPLGRLRRLAALTTETARPIPRLRTGDSRSAIGLGECAGAFCF